MRYWLVMPAAGSSQRFGGSTPKQYQPLAGRTLIEWSLAPFLADARCQGVRIALAPGDAHFAGLPAARDPRIRAVPGGAERAESVMAALAAVDAADADWIMVHDAARPCVSAEEIGSLIAAAGTCGSGALLALPVTDTLKSSANADAMLATVPRQGLWRALTPQLFSAGRLRSALQSAYAQGRTPTDESQAIEWLGESPTLVHGSAMNLKVTDPSDLALAAAILRLREGAG